MATHYLPNSELVFRQQIWEQSRTGISAHKVVAYVPQGPQLLATTRRGVEFLRRTAPWIDGPLMLEVGRTHRATGQPRTRTLGSTIATLARRVVPTHAPGPPLVEERLRRCHRPSGDNSEESLKGGSSATWLAARSNTYATEHFSHRKTRPVSMSARAATSRNISSKTAWVASSNHASSTQGTLVKLRASSATPRPLCCQF